METPKVLVACLHCDRKAHNQLVPHQSIAALTYQNKIIYYSIETEDEQAFAPLFKAIKDHKELTVHTDTWKFASSWWRKPAFDQDQQRLVPICIARNMSVEAALGLGCDYLMFVDSDMTIEPDTIERFLETANKYNRPIVFGHVQGRNDHKHAEYVFGGKHGLIELGDGVVELHHGNIGFAMIHLSVFEKLRFRHGPHITDNSVQSDDPNFISDAVHALGMAWPVLHRAIKAFHKDEEILPFEGGAQY